MKTENYIFFSEMKVFSAGEIFSASKNFSACRNRKCFKRSEA